jgi:hypothetical protein
MENKSKVYILIDSQNRILRCEGGYTLSNIQNIDEWTLIDEGIGDRFNLCQSHYFDGGLYTEGGICRYAYENNTIHLRSNKEIEADRLALNPEPISTPTQLDRIEAQVAYTAMMTDTLLED